MIWKVLAVIGFLFWTYCLLQILTKWQYRTPVQKGIWFLVLAVGYWWCLHQFGVM